VLGKTNLEADKIAIGQGGQLERSGAKHTSVEITVGQIIPKSLREGKEAGGVLSWLEGLRDL